MPRFNQYPASQFVAMCATGPLVRRTALPLLMAVTLALVAAALFGVTPAQGQTVNTLVSNTAQDPGHGASVMNSEFPKWSQPFTTGSNLTGYTLTSIGIVFDVIDDTATAGADLEVRLHQVKSNGHPGDALCTLSDPASFSASGLHTFAAPTSGVGACPGLARRSTYAVVAERVSGSDSSRIHVNTTFDDMEDSSPAPGWSIADVSHAYAPLPLGPHTRCGWRMEVIPA